MKVLIYGFGPWGKLKENITEEVLIKIKNRKNLRKVVFDVRFCRNQFIEEIVKFKPEIIIGMGQYPQGNKLRIERRAINLKKDLKEERILKNGPNFLFSTLRIKNSNNFKISYNAGKYVCNYSMYVISDFIKNKNIKFSFVHIPREYNVAMAVKQIEEIIQTFE